MGPTSWETAVWAGLLRGGADAVVGSRAAAYLHKLTRDAPKEVVIWAFGRRAGFQVDDVAVTFRRGQRAGRGSPPRTAVEASLLDAASDVSEDELVCR